MLDIISQIFSSKVVQLLGGSAVVLSAIAAVFFERLKVFWKRRSDSEIEALKGEIQKGNSTLNSLASSYLNNFNKVQDKRIEAAEKLWASVLEIKRGMPKVILLAYQILLDEELSNDKFNKSQTMRDQVQQLNEAEATNYLHPIDEALETFKPFIGDSTYILFSAYLGFIGRTTFQFIKRYKEENLSTWKTDPGIKGMLKPVLTEEEIKSLYSMRINSFGTALNLLETKILIEIRENLYGKNMTLDTIKHIQLMNVYLQKFTQ